MLKTPVFKMFLPISPLRRFAPAPPSVGEPWMVQQPANLKLEPSFVSILLHIPLPCKSQ